MGREKYLDSTIRNMIDRLIPQTKIRKISLDIFEEALTHISMMKENGECYERLEFLGDAVFKLIISDYLFIRYKNQDEGFLTKLRTKIERGESMSEMSKTLGLNRLLIIDTDVTINDKILENVFESFLGAFYLNFGYEITKSFIIALIEQERDISQLITTEDNYKDVLVRYFHSQKWREPNFESSKSNGRYHSEVYDPANNVLGEGKGSTKKKAEQRAAKAALISLEILVDGCIIEKKSRKSINKIDEEEIWNSKNVLINFKNLWNIMHNYRIFLEKKNASMKYFVEAMTHGSYLVRGRRRRSCKNCVSLQVTSNDRLKFLGDAVLHFLLANYLYRKYPQKDEGFLTQLRSSMERRRLIAKISNAVGIVDYILISKNIEEIGGRTSQSILSKAFIAFVAALYLTFGIDTPNQFIRKIVTYHLDLNKLIDNMINYKDIILKRCRSGELGEFEFKVIDETGPDNNRTYTIGACLNGIIMGKGSASSKKKAEQIACKDMYFNNEELLK